jgi:hypothetical protein
VAKRAEFRVHHVGTKLNERELGELEALLARRGQSQGEFIRGLILAEIERDRQGVSASVELEEITALGRDVFLLAAHSTMVPAQQLQVTVQLPFGGDVS